MIIDESTHSNINAKLQGQTARPWTLKITREELMTFSSYGRSIDSIAMTKIIVVGRKQVQKGNKDYKIGLGARTLGQQSPDICCRLQILA